MGEINQGRYDALLRRLATQVGGGSRVGNALEDLFPTLDVENGPMEILRPSGWYFGAGAIDRTAAVGTINVQQLFNPPNSNYLMVVTSLHIHVNTSGTVRWGPAFDALADASVPGAQRDTREAVIRSTVGLLQREDGGTGSSFGGTFIPANTLFAMDDPNGIAVLAPGTSWRITQLTTNARLFTSWMWRERIAEPGELEF